MISDMYLAILENANDAVVICGPDSKIIFWNNSAEHIFGYKKDEIIGREAIVLAPDKDKKAHEQGISNYLNTGILTHDKPFAIDAVRKDGAIVPVEITLTKYEEKGQRFITGVIRDITRRRNAELQIQSQIEKLKALRSIDMAITSSLDIRLTFSIILEQVMSTLHADAVDVLLLNQYTLRLEYVAGKGFRTNALHHTNLGIGEGVAGRTAQDARIKVIDLKKEASSFIRAPLIAEEGMMTYISVPLQSKGNMKGVLEVFYRSEVKPSPELLDFAEALGLQSAIAIDNASLFNELTKANMDLKLAYESTLEGWSRALDLRDKETEGHSQRVTDLTVSIARELGIHDEELVHVRRGALLHDIGKMGVPDQILLKPGPLNEEERAIMCKHPVYAYYLLMPIAYLRPAIDIPYCHHEKWDGTGYPRGLKGEEIPLAARIFAIVDVWDALRSDRPYRPARSAEDTISYIVSQSGNHFEPRIVKVFLNAVGTGLS